MSDPTLAAIIAQRDDERAAKVEAERLQAKTTLLNRLANDLSKIDAALEGLRQRKKILKEARAIIRSVADDSEISVEDLKAITAELETLRVKQFAMDADVYIAIDPSSAGGFAVGGYVNAPLCAPCSH